MGDHVLFLDDQRRRSAFYREALEALGFKVKYVDRVSEFWKALGEDGGAPRGIVVDSMMPNDTHTSAPSIAEDLLTGVRIYRELREKGYHSTRIVIFTNNTDPAIPAATLGDPNAKVIMKPIVLYSEFAQIAARFFGADGLEGATNA